MAILVPFPGNGDRSRKVHKPGVLSTIEDIRTIPMSEQEKDAIENAALLLGQLGAQPIAMLLLGLAARWKVAA